MDIMATQKTQTYKGSYATSIKQEFLELLKHCQQCGYQEKQEIEEAFRVAHEAHADQQRKTGEPFIMHPLAVARIVSEEMKIPP